MTAAEALRKIAATTDAALVEAWWRIEKAQAPVLAYRKMEADAGKRGHAFHLTKELAEAERALDVAKAIAAPLEAVAAAGNWSRFVLVPGGHLHRGFGCSTLRWTTQTGLMPEYSGADEKEIVEIAGEVACTVCFPSAPVDRPTSIPALVKEREEREALAAERAAKKEAAEAQKIQVGTQTYKSQRAAENAISWEIENVVSRRFMEARDADHRRYLDGMADADLAHARRIATAIADTVEGYSADEILAKKFAAKVKQYRKAGWEIPADAAL